MESRPPTNPQAPNLVSFAPKDSSPGSESDFPTAALFSRTFDSTTPRVERARFKHVERRLERLASSSGQLTELSLSSERVDDPKHSPVSVALTRLFSGDELPFLAPVGLIH
jgi:hypothetical protein